MVKKTNKETNSSRLTHPHAKSKRLQIQNHADLKSYKFIGHKIININVLDKLGETGKR